MDNRSAILHHALQLFAARGYDAVGVQEVAEAAGITKPTLYHYYGSKQGLLTALVDTYQETFNRLVEQAARYAGDLPGSLANLARAYFQFAQEQPVYYRMLLAMYFAPRDSEAHRLTENRNQRQYVLVEAMFAAATHDHGNMRNRQRLYAATYIGMLNTCIGLWLNEHAELDETLIQRIVQQFQYGIYS